MSAIAGIKAEMVEVEAVRKVAAAQVDLSHKAFTDARGVYREDQAVVTNLSERIARLHAALAALSVTESTEGKP